MRRRDLRLLSGLVLISLIDSCVNVSNVKTKGLQKFTPKGKSQFFELVKKGDHGFLFLKVNPTKKKESDIISSELPSLFNLG